MRTLAQSLWTRMHRLFGEEQAATATEYAVMLALILVACLAAVRALGEGLANNVAWTISDAIS